MVEPASRARGLDDANPTALPAPRLGPDNNLDVLAEPRQKAHEALARKTREPAVQERGDFRLIDARDGRCADLNQAISANDVADTARELRFCQLLFWLRDTDVGEHIAGAWRHRDVLFFRHCS